MALENQPSFTAPSIPKMGRIKISSPISSVSKTAKLKKTSFSFKKPSLKITKASFDKDKKTSFSFKKPSLKITKASFDKDKIINQPFQSSNNVVPTLVETNKIINQPFQSSNNVVPTLVETNKILVEIQKQLALDFANRIAERKEAISAYKKSVEKNKLQEEETSLETGSKKIKKIEGVFDKVTAPIKGIFSRILDFLGLFATGILANAAFEWLKNDENRKKLGDILKWVGGGLLVGIAAFVGYKVFKALRATWKFAKFLVKVGRGFVGVVGRIGRLLGKALGITPRGPSLAQGAGKTGTALLTKTQQEARVKLAEEVSRKGLKAKGAIIGGKYISVTAEEAPKLLAKPNILQKGLSKIGQFGDNLTKTLVNPIIKFVLPNIPPKVQTKVAEAVASKGLKRFLPYVNTILAIPEALSRIMSGDYEGALLSAAGAIPIVGWGALALDIYRSVDPEGYAKNIRGGMSFEDMNKSITEGTVQGLGNIGPAFTFSRGGTIGRGDQAGTDKVPVGSRYLLDEGEEAVIIRSSAARNFRPLLKDINDNAGRMWIAFEQGIKEQQSNSEKQKEVNKEFKETLDGFGKELEELTKKEKEKERKRLLERSSSLDYTEEQATIDRERAKIEAENERRKARGEDPLPLPKNLSQQNQDIMKGYNDVIASHRKPKTSQSAYSMPSKLSSDPMTSYRPSSGGVNFVSFSLPPITLNNGSSQQGRSQSPTATDTINSDPIDPYNLNIPLNYENYGIFR